MPGLEGPVRVLLSPDLGDLGPLLEANRRQLERELGAPIALDSCDVGDGPSQAAGSDWNIRLGASAPRLVVDRGRRALTTEAPDRSSLVEVFSLLHSLHRLSDGTHEVRDCASVVEAVETVARTVEESWPSFGVRGIDWGACCARWRPRVLAAADPVAELRAWLAELGDAHTWIRPRRPAGRLPYEARVVGDAVILDEVPSGTEGRRAGARPGQRLLGFDGLEAWRTTAASPHSRARVAGLRALQGPDGQALEVVTDAGARWTERRSLAPWPDVIESRVLPSGEGYVRIRAFLRDREPLLDAALDGLRGRDLVIDLRGNGGGDQSMAFRLRDRFVRAAGPVGSIRWTHPRGGLTDAEPLLATPSAAPWDGRVTFLVDEMTYSAAEDALLGLAGRPHVRILGRPTGGGSGRVRSVRLHAGWSLTVSTCLTFTLDGRCVEGAGLSVDGSIPEGLLPDEAPA
jgi:carboxyl-terminal processing protease